MVPDIPGQMLKRSSTTERREEIVFSRICPFIEIVFPNTAGHFVQPSNHDQIKKSKKVESDVPVTCRSCLGSGRISEGVKIPDSCRKIMGAFSHNHPPVPEA